MACHLYIGVVVVATDDVCNAVVHLDTILCSVVTLVALQYATSTACIALDTPVASGTRDTVVVHPGFCVEVNTLIGGIGNKIIVDLIRLASTGIQPYSKCCAGFDVVPRNLQVIRAIAKYSRNIDAIVVIVELVSSYDNIIGIAYAYRTSVPACCCGVTDCISFYYDMRRRLRRPYFICSTNVYSLSAIVVADVIRKCAINRSLASTSVTLSHGRPIRVTSIAGHREIAAPQDLDTAKGAT